MNVGYPVDRLRILRIVNSFGETSPEFRQFSVPMMDQQDIFICSYYSTTSEIPQPINFYDGNNSVSSFLRVLSKILNSADFDLIHAHYAHVAVLSLILLVFRYPRLLRRTVYTVHTSYSNLKFRNRILTLITFIFYRNIVFCGYSSSSSFPPFYHRLLGKRAHIIQNGADVNQINRVLEETISDKSGQVDSIVSVGRLIPLKNTKILLRAIAKIEDPTIKIKIVGEGPQYPILVELAEELGISELVTFTGTIQRHEVYRILCKSDLFISMSRIEGLPIATIEAMTARCLVILSDIEPHQEIVRNYEGIPLVDPDDIAGLIRQIEIFKNMTLEQRLQIGANNRKIALTQFSAERMLSEYQELYHRIVERS